MPESALLLSAGYGTRLRPLTNSWPKCLMPVHGTPLLEHWLRALIDLGLENILVNTHHHAKFVDEFLARKIFSAKVKSMFEPTLLGTAGSVRANASLLSSGSVLLVHADNWCQCDLHKFFKFHYQCRAKKSSDHAITMMTFRTSEPKSCGIVELDENGFVQKMHEKCQNTPSNLANAAVYIIEQEVVRWIIENPDVTDFSTQVLNHYMGRISAWENTQIHRDIGSIEMLAKAQNEGHPIVEISDEWTLKFKENQVQKAVFGADK